MVVGVVKWLMVVNMVVVCVIECFRMMLMVEGEWCVDEGLFEVCVFVCVLEEGIELDVFRMRAGSGAVDVGFK